MSDQRNDSPPDQEATAEDVIAAIRLACFFDKDPRDTLRVVGLLLEQAPPTSGADTGGTALLIRMVREDRLKLEAPHG